MKTQIRREIPYNYTSAEDEQVVRRSYKRIARLAVHQEILQALRNRGDRNSNRRGADGDPDEHAGT